MNDEQYARRGCASAPLDLFFGRSDEKPSDRRVREREAKMVCWSCPDDVRDVCLVEALTRDEPWGVWGGLNPNERWTVLNRPADSVIQPALALGMAR